MTGKQASRIHLLKHRISVSINGESARYKALKENKVYYPEDWNVKWTQKLVEHTERGNELYHESLVELTELLGRKRTKESARFFKTMNSQITMDVMFNWRSFYRFLNLRNKPDAQLEIRQIAKEMLDLVVNIEDNPFKHTIKAFNL